MPASSYLAQFRSAAGDFFVAALAWPAPAAPLLPSACWRVLQTSTEVDIALRLIGGKQPRAVTLLTADCAQALTTVLETLDRTTKVAGAGRADDAGEFDTLTSITLWPAHLRVWHEGYHRGGQQLGCNFRLYSAWVGQGLPEGMVYQLALRSQRPEMEQERRVRKYLAWLDLEKPFTPPVSAMQEILTRRLLAPGWLADEYLLFPDIILREAWSERIRAQFSNTTGRIGFREAPIEAGDFSDWLTVGCHTARDCGVPPSLPVLGACTFSGDEVSWLARQSLVSPAPGAPVGVPDIFISYSSGDFAQADAARQHLESVGWRCWIAPRDINTTGLPYTEAIPRAIEQVRAVVILLSPSANLSVHIPRELDLALARKLPLLPLRLVDLYPTGQLEYLLRTCQYLDVFGRNPNDAMSELVARLRSLGL